MHEKQTPGTSAAILDLFALNSHQGLICESSCRSIQQRSSAVVLAIVEEERVRVHASPRLP